MAAAGVPGIITADMVKPGAAVLDVGVSRVDGKIAGDVADDVWDVAGWVSPNPGGVGPMTRAMLLSNLVLMAEQAQVTFVTDQPPAESPVPGDTRRRAGPSPEEIAEELDAVAEEHEAIEAERRYPSTIGGAFYLLVLAVSAVAIGIVCDRATGGSASVAWPARSLRRAVRPVLPARDAGMLAVRNRWTASSATGASCLLAARSPRCRDSSSS